MYQFFENPPYEEGDVLLCTRSNESEWYTVGKQYTLKQRNGIGLYVTADNDQELNGYSAEWEKVVEYPLNVGDEVTWGCEDWSYKIKEIKGEYAVMDSKTRYDLRGGYHNGGCVDHTIRLSKLRLPKKATKFDKSKVYMYSDPYRTYTGSVRAEFVTEYPCGKNIPGYVFLIQVGAYQEVRTLTAYEADTAITEVPETRDVYVAIDSGGQATVSDRPITGEYGEAKVTIKRK